MTDSGGTRTSSPDLLARLRQLEQANESLRAQLEQAHAKLTASSVSAVVPSDQHYRLLFDHNPDGVFAVDPAGRFIVANPACEQICGWSIAELLQKNFIDLCAPDQLQQTLAHFVAGTTDLRYQQFETVLIRKDGRRVDLWIAGEPMLVDGQLVAIHCTARDITSRRMGEAALRESEEKLRLLGDNLPDSAVYQYVREDAALPGRFTYFSAGVERLNGVAVADVLRDAGVLYRQIVPEYLQRLMLEEERCLREMCDFDMDVPMRRPDGQVRWIRLHSRPRRLPDGHVVWDGVQTDVTDRRIAEETLRRYQLLAQHSRDIILFINRDDGRIIEANDAAVGAYGYPREELLGLTILDLREPGTHSAAAAQMALADMEGIQFETIHRRKDGSTFPVEVSAQAATIGQARTLISVIRDITPRKAAERERELAIEFLHVVSSGDTMRQVVRAAVECLQRLSGCAAVGVRLREGNDFPYYESSGFPADFIRHENHRFCRDAKGELMLDDQGLPYVECLCQNVIHGRFDRSQPFFTSGGSFWTNSTTALLAENADAQRPAPAPNCCNVAGYQSMALVPLHVGSQRLGVIHFADPAPGRLDPDKIALWERLGNALAVAIARARAEESLSEGERRFRQVVESLPQLVWTCQPDGPCDYLSPQWVAYTGVPASAQLGYGWIEQLHPDDRQTAVEHWQAMTARGDVSRIEFRIRRHDGVYRWFHTVANPLRDETGRIVKWFGTNTDVDERKQAEGVLEYLASFPGRNPSPIVEATLDGAIRYANPTALRLLPDLETLGPAHPWLADWAALTAPFRNGETAVAEREVTVGGRTFHQTLNFFPADGFIRVYGYDITQRQEAEQELQRALGRYALLSRTAGALLASSDAQLVVESLCRAVMSHLGCDVFFNFLVDESAGRLHLNACSGIPAEEVAKLQWLDFGVAVCGCVARDGCRIVATDIQNPARDDPRTDLVRSYGVQAYCCHPLMAGGKLIGTLSFGTRARPEFTPDDIELMRAVSDQVAIAMERMQAEQSLRESEDRFRTTANGLPLFVWVHGPDGQQQFVNRTFCEFFGVAEKEMRGGRWQALIHPDDAQAYADEFASCVRQRRPFHAEARVRRADGQWRWVESWARPRFSGAGDFLGFVGASADITDRKATEAALRAAQLQAEAASKAKDHFLAVLSHELRTPLTPVLMAASSLEGDPALGAGQRETLAVIRRNVELEARLIDDLLDVTRVAQGKVRLDRRVIDLRQVLRHAAATCDADARTKSQSLVVETGTRPLWVDGDSARLEQIFWNLLRNAVKFTPERGEVRLRARIAEDSASPAPGDGAVSPPLPRLVVVVEVSDSGIGIDPVRLPHIFDAFEQTSEGRRFGGLGLGLSIVRSLVELHDGAVTARSAGPDQGATFAVTLPLATPAAGANTLHIAPAASAGAATASRPTLRILLVEDHLDTASIMTHFLRKLGHSVSHAHDVASGLNLAIASEFDLLISDLGLPDGSGIDLMRQLRTRRPLLPAIVLSGYGMEQDIENSRQAGFLLHLTKPVNKAQLHSAIATVMQVAPPLACPTAPACEDLI